MDNTVAEWRLNSKEKTRLTEEKTHPVDCHRRRTHRQAKIFKTWRAESLNVSTHANRDLTHKRSRQTSMCPLSSLASAPPRYAPAKLTRRQIAKIDVRTNTKSRTASRNHTFRHTKSSSLDRYMQPTTARIASAIAHPGMMAWSRTTYQKLSKIFAFKQRLTALTWRTLY